MDALHPAAAPEEFLAHAERLRALARRLVKDDARADDLLQETWLEAQRRPRASIGNLGSWLAGVVRNLAREERRGEGRRARRETAVARGEGLPSTADVVLRIEGFRDVAREVQTLAEPYRTTIVRLYFDGLTAEELAAREGVASATIRSRHLRALQELRKRLDDRPGGRAAWVALLLPELGERARSAPSTALPWVLGALVLVSTALLVWQPWTPAATPSGAMESARAAAGEHAPRAASATEPAPQRSVAATTELAPTFPLDLVLVDARTRAPLPAFALVATDDAGGSERLVSDEHGRVRGARAFAPGELALRLLDEPRLAAWRERRLPDRNLAWIVPWTHARAKTPLELPLDVGPTFELALTGAAPADVEALVCRLVASSPDAAVRESRAPVRNGPRGAWVRFASEARALAGPAPWRFEARTEFAVATTSVDALDGGGRLELAFEPRGVLVVELVDEDGAHVAGRVDLSGASASDLAEPAWSAPGVARFSGLAPGAWSVLAREFVHADARAEVEVVPGEVRALRIVLARRPSAGDVAGEVRFEARYDAHVVVELARRDAPELVRRVELEADSERATNFPFAFRGLPDGEYVVRASAPGLHRWRENDVVARPGATGLVLGAGAPAPSRPLVLRAFDAESGAPLEHFQARVDVDPITPGNRRTTRKSSILVGGVPIGAHVEWTIVAEGYVPALGDERAFEDEGDHGVVRARLQRGFGRRVLVLDARGAPLAHARVTAEPDLAAETDAEGVAWFRGAAVPRTIVLEHGATRVERDVRGLESDGLATWTARLP